MPRIWCCRRKEAANQGRLWTPLLDPNLYEWWDFGDRSTISLSTGIASITGKRRGLVLSQAAGSKQPTLQLDPLAGYLARFSGAQRLVNSTVTLSQPFGVHFGVVSSDTNGTIVDSYNDVRAFIGIEAGQYTLSFSPSSPTYTALNASWDVRSNVINGASSYVVANGVTLGTSSPGTNSYSGMSVGDLRGNPDPIVSTYEFTGDIYQLVLTSGSPSARDLSRYQGFIAWRAAKQHFLAATHPFRNRPPLIGD